MEMQTLNEERPYIRPFRSTLPWPLVVGVLVAAALAAVFYYQVQSGRPRPEAPALTSAAVAPEAPPANAPTSASAPAASSPAPQADAASLPQLENSDSLARESLSRLMGREAFSELVIPIALVRRIVATVDNLPRETAPRRVMPLNAVPGAFTPDASNYARYTPYVRVFDAIEPHDLVQAYVRAYPLFQAAYEELGYPGKYFNDRLMEAIDDLLDAPEPATPPEFLRPRVLYEFADPDLETRSAGQKMLLRMGRDNAARVKGKLREIRRELVAATVRR